MMSIVVWDGKTLAADTASVCSDMMSTSYKTCSIESPDGIEVCAFTGGLAEGQVLAHWYFSGADPSKWPDFQKNDDWTRLIVADKHGCKFFEKQPYPIKVFDKFAAFGSGRDFAIGALAMGASAKKAVEVASKYSTTCGIPAGVEVYNLHKKAK